MYSRILWIALFLVLSCNTPNDKGLIFSITKIEQGKDGKTLFLEDSEGTLYTTVVSIPNGNYIDVEVGDKVRLEIKEIVENMDPIILITRSIEKLN